MDAIKTFPALVHQTGETGPGTTALVGAGPDSSAANSAANQLAGSQGLPGKAPVAWREPAAGMANDNPGRLSQPLRLGDYADGFKHKMKRLRQALMCSTCLPPAAVM